jgi:hypothetical protein
LNQSVAPAVLKKVLQQNPLKSGAIDGVIGQQLVDS